MSTQNQTQVAAELSISVTALWALSANPQFPRPVSGSDQNVLWDSTAIASFVTLWTGALTNGWKIPPSILPTMNVQAMAAAAPGRYYMHAHMGDPLFS